MENTSLSRDRFVIQRRLGQGAMGVVYAAHDRQRNRQVAIKTLAHLDATSIFRLKNEFRALSNLSHPNFIGLHELLFAGGQWLLTMDLVDGVDFLRWVRPEPDEKNDATAIAELDLERLRAAAVQLA
ncbi:MAG TPA: protein kinase, partial [Polyangiaceae bacterium]